MHSSSAPDRESAPRRRGGFAALGVKVALAARNVQKLDGLVQDIGAAAFAADTSDPQSVAALFDQAAARIGDPEIVIYNAAARAQGPLAGLDAAAVAKIPASHRLRRISGRAAGGDTHAAARARRILFTGATASVKGFAHSAAFAMGKFALRGLAQSAARELGPKGIHVAHFIIDGAVRSAQRPESADKPDSTLDRMP